MHQTLTTLDLYLNEIGAEGARHLADTLQINKVRLISYPLIADFHLNQTLTTLLLIDNQIGNEGAQHLANALQTNRVHELSYSLMKH